MMRPSWQAYAYYLWPRYGWTAAAGAVLLLLAGVVQGWVVPDLQAQTQEARQAVQAAHARASAPTAAEAALARQAQWLAALPAARTALEVVNTIDQAAHRHGVRLARGEYRWSPEPGARFSRYQMTFPVQGRYTDIQAWLADTMNATPALALEGWSVTRDTIATEMLDGTVRFTLYTGAQ